MSSDHEAAVAAADAHTRDLAEAAGENPTAWFERLYAQASRGAAQVPWDRRLPSVLLSVWAEREQVDGTGQTAIVVGAGYGRDSEFVSALGFQTTAFDISPTAVRDTRVRFPNTTVDYVAADLLALPPAWLGGFDLVVEAMTVQSLPESLRSEATRAVASLVAPEGTLVVVAAARDEGGHVDGPPWPLTLSQAAAFATGGLEQLELERIPDAVDPEVHRWLGLFTRLTSHASAQGVSG
ncbi:MAG: class I SAM-dependent methyltransferase [Pedococcus sp.]